MIDQPLAAISIVALAARRASCIRETPNFDNLFNNTKMKLNNVALLRGRPIPLPKPRKKAQKRAQGENMRKNVVFSAQHGDCILIPHWSVAGFIPYVKARGWTHIKEDAGWIEMENGILGQQKFRCCYLFFLDPAVTDKEESIS